MSLNPDVDDSFHPRDISLRDSQMTGNEKCLAILDETDPIKENTRDLVDMSDLNKKDTEFIEECEFQINSHQVTTPTMQKNIEDLIDIYNRISLEYQQEDLMRYQEDPINVNTCSTCKIPEATNVGIVKDIKPPTLEYLEKEREELLHKLTLNSKAIEDVSSSFVDRFSVIPVKNPIFYSLYKKQEKKHWVAGEFDFSQDKADWLALKSNGMHLEAWWIEIYIVVTYAIDGAIGSNVSDRFILETFNYEDKLVLNFMQYMEGVHGETYGKLGYYFFGIAIKEKVRSLMNEPFMKERNKLLDKYTLSNLTKTERRVGIAAIEGISLKNLFLIIYYIDTLNICSNIVDLNENINIDEGYHSLTDCEMALETNKVDNIDSSIMYDEIDEVVQAEDLVSEYIYKDSDKSLNVETSKILTRYYANQVLENLHLPPKYQVVIPKELSWMTLIGLDRKTSYFDRKKEYHRISEETKLTINSISNYDDI